MTTKVLPEVLTVSEVAKALKLSESRVRQLIDSGTIPTSQPGGGHHRIRVEDVAALLDPRR